MNQFYISEAINFKLKHIINLTFTPLKFYKYGRYEFLYESPIFLLKSSYLWY